MYPHKLKQLIWYLDYGGGGLQVIGIFKSAYKMAVKYPSVAFLSVTTGLTRIDA